MKCPYCNKELNFIAPVETNCEVYGGYPKGVTMCCGNIVKLQRIITLRASTVDSSITVDDWGNPKKK